MLYINYTSSTNSSSLLCFYTRLLLKFSRCLNGISQNGMITMLMRSFAEGLLRPSYYLIFVRSTPDLANKNRITYTTRQKYYIHSPIFLPTPPSMYKQEGILCFWKKNCNTDMSTKILTTKVLIFIYLGITLTSP
jgi:hypothetical protein